MGQDSREDLEVEAGEEIGVTVSFMYDVIIKPFNFGEDPLPQTR